MLSNLSCLMKAFLKNYLFISDTLNCVTTYFFTIAINNNIENEMKNLLNFTFLVVSFVVAWQCNSVKKSFRMSSFILQNIEALADDNESGATVICSGSGSVDCSFLKRKLKK